MRIITISRQFGSGGRELGRRLADVLDWDYYDKEIILALAQEQGLDPEYVHRMLSNHGWHHYQLTYRNSFRQPLAGSWRQTELLVKQREILKEIAEADVILHDAAPFRVFVCAEMASRIERCARHEEKKEPEERLTEKEILRNIRRIDRNRRHIREVLTGKTASDGSTFDLTVNATRWNIQKLAEAVAEFSGSWFENNEKNKQEE